MGIWDRIFGRTTRTVAPQLPAPAPPASEAQQRRDGIFNLFMGQGTMKDKRSGTGFFADVVDDVTAQELWRGDHLGRKVVQTAPDDAMRNGYELDLDGDKQLAENVTDALKSLRANWFIREAKRYERAFGGAAIFPYINDGGDLSEPLNESRVSEVRNLVLFQPQELQATRWYNDLEADKKFRLPKAYRMFPLFGGATSNLMGSTEIHESRLIIFPGVKVTNGIQRGCRPGWGDSVFTRMYRVLLNFNLSWSSLTALVDDFSQAVMSIKELAETIGEGGEDDIKAQIALMDSVRATMRIIPIDSEDKFERITTPLTGLDALIDRMMIMIATAADQPVTKFWGRSPAGMNSTGEGDEAIWDDQVKTMQTDELSDPILRLVELVCKSNMGPTKGKLPKSRSVNWRPLRQPTDDETAGAHEKQANADKIYLDYQVLSPEEVAHSRFGGDKYSYETSVDWKARASETMVVDPIVKPEPEPLPLPAAGGTEPGAPAPAAEQPQPENEGMRAARQAADSLPTRDRYDVLDVAMAKDHGVMVALYLPRAFADELAVEGGQPASDLHITLAYLGTDLPDVAIQRAAGVAYDAAMRRQPPRAKLAGVGRFGATRSSGGKDPVYAAVDSVDICELRNAICCHLECLSVPVAKDHGFIPHITLAYVDPDAPSPVTSVPPYELEFPAIVVAAGNERVIYPFKGEREQAGGVARVAGY